MKVEVGRDPPLEAWLVAADGDGSAVIVDQNGGVAIHDLDCITVTPEELARLKREGP